MLTTLNATTQGILPNWIRGRGLAIYLTVFNGAMAAGSLGWGFVAQGIGTDAALLVAGSRIGHRGGRSPIAPPCRAAKAISPRRCTGPSRRWPSRWRMTAGR